MFGHDLGPNDDGKASMERPLPGGYGMARFTPQTMGDYAAAGNNVGANGKVAIKETFAGDPEKSNPAFKGAHPNAIRWAQTQVNYEKAMGGLIHNEMEGTPLKASKMVDIGMGRESDGVSRPVHSYVDERIKLPKEK
jgi:hypothetical protein